MLEYYEDGKNEISRFSILGSNHFSILLSSFFSVPVSSVALWVRESGRVSEGPGLRAPAWAAFSPSLPLAVPAPPFMARCLSGPGSPCVALCHSFNSHVSL